MDLVEPLVRPSGATFARVTFHSQLSSKRGQDAGYK